MEPLAMFADRARIIGISLAAVAALSYGWSLVFGKLAYQGGMTTLTLLSYRFGLSALLLWTYCLLFARRDLVTTARDLVICLALGALAYGTLILCYFHALNFISVALTGLIFYLNPSFTTLLARIFFREPLTRRKLLALILTFLGTGLIVGFQFGGIDPRGVVLAFLAALVASVYVLVSQGVLKTTPPRTVSLYLITGVALFFTFFHSPLRFFSELPPVRALIPLFLLVGVSTIPPLFISLMAIERIGAARSAMVSFLEPVTTVTAAYLILGEQLTPLQLVGAATIIGGVILVYKT